MPNGNGNAGSWKILTLVAPIVTTVNLGIAAWIIRILFGMQAEHVEIWKELAVKADIANIPTPEVIRRLDGHEEQINRLRDRVNGVGL
jgi:hypothetical protein